MIYDAILPILRREGLETLVRYPVVVSLCGGDYTPLRDDAPEALIEYRTSSAVALRGKRVVEGAFHAEGVQWPPSTLEARWVVLEMDHPGGRVLVSCLDLGRAHRADGGPIELDWDERGILTEG